MTLEELQQIHQDFENEFWDAPKDEPGYTRHVLEHLAKLMGKLGNIVEPREHGIEPSTDTIKREVIPDLLYFSLGLAAVNDIDPEKAYLERLKANQAKIEGRREGILESSSQ